MNRKNVLSGIVLLFLAVINFTSCSNEVKLGDEMKIVKIIVSAQTGFYKSGDLTQDIPSIEGMQMKEDGNDNWHVVPFDKITGFEYKKGYNYKLLVEKTVLLDMPAYVGGTTYKLIEVLSMRRKE